jgi:hypothetical protein
MGSIEGILQEKVRINGACTMASAPANWHALAPREARYTAFTGALLELLRDGIADGPEILPIGLVHERLSQIMTARGLPEPQLSATNTVEQLGLVRNRAYQEPQAAKMSATTNPAAAANRPAAPRARARFQQRRGYGWFDRLSWRLSAWGPLVAVIASWHALHPGLRLILAVVYGLLSAFVLFFIRDLYPVNYVLILDHDGIELVVGTSRSRYPWHRVREVRLVPDRRYARRSGHVLVLELQPGTLPPEGRFLAPVPRWDQALNGIRFARTARLAGSDEDIERALGRFARAAWRPARDISLTGDARHYRIRRARLAAGAAVLLALGLSPLFLFCGLLYGQMPIGTLTCAAVWAVILSVPGLIAAAWARYPGHLKLDGEGIEVELGGRISRVAWHDVERARITGWLLEKAGDRLLAVRQWPSSALPRSWITLPWTFRRAGVAILCPVQLFAARREDLRAALDRFAGPAWEPGTGLYAPVEDTADRVRFAGRLTGPRTLLTALAGIIVLLLLQYLFGLMTVPAAAVPFEWPLYISTTAAEFGLIAAGILMSRDRFGFTIDANGLTLQIGRAPTFLPWDDIDRIAIIRSSSSAMRKDHDRLVVWLREETMLPRRWWRILRLMRPALGGVAIIELNETNKWQTGLFATPTELERALARYAGARLVPEHDATRQ